MKNLSFISVASGITLLFFSLLFASCNKNKSPEKVAFEFQKAIENYDFESAKKWVIPEGAAMIDFAAMVTSEEHKKLRKEHKADIRVDSTFIDESGTSANVYLTVLNPIPTNILDEDKVEISAEPTTKNIELVKRDGKWLVNLDAK